MCAKRFAVRRELVTVPCVMYRSCKRAPSSSTVGQCDRYLNPVRSFVCNWIVQRVGSKAVNRHVFAFEAVGRVPTKPALIIDDPELSGSVIDVVNSISEAARKGTGIDRLSNAHNFLHKDG